MSASSHALSAEEIVQLTCDLIAAPSENPGGTEAAAVAVLASALERIGARVSLSEVAPGRPNLFARIGPDRPGGVLFLGHSDVVPAGEGWSADPFTPRRTDTEIIGRGATDMKGGLAAVVAAMAAIHQQQPQIPVSLLCTVDEEADARGAQHYLQHADAQSYDACIVAEPTNLTTIIGCRGATNLHITVSGMSAHAGRPSDGASAILAATELIAAVEQDAARLAERPHPVLGAATWNVGQIQGGHGTSIVPDRCDLDIDRRLLPGEDPETILQQLLTASRDRVAAAQRPGWNRIRFDGMVEMTMPGFVTEPDASLVKIATDAVRDQGFPGTHDIWTASCEGGFIASHHRVPTIVLGPGDITGQAHQPDERVSINELIAAAAAYTSIALRIDNEVERAR